MIMQVHAFEIASKLALRAGWNMAVYLRIFGLIQEKRDHERHNHPRGRSHR
jgi:hypothetical protein